MSRFLKRAQAVFGAIVAAALFCGLATAGLAKKLPTKPIDLNRATLAQLEQLPGIGPVRARQILEFRRKSGPFESVNDLLALPGIGPKRFKKLRPYVTVVPLKKKPKPSKPPDTSHDGNARGHACIRTFTATSFFLFRWLCA